MSRSGLDQHHSIAAQVYASLQHPDIHASPSAASYPPFPVAPEDVPPPPTHNNNLSHAISQSLPPALHHPIPSSHSIGRGPHFGPNLSPEPHNIIHHDLASASPSVAREVQPPPRGGTLISLPQPPPQRLDSTSSSMSHEPPPPPQHGGVVINPESQRPTTPPPPHEPPLTPNTAPEGEFDMLPPPYSTFSSFTSLHTYAQAHAAAHGYALSINTTSKNRSRIKLACVCYGIPKNTHKLTPETRVRKNRVSSKTGCRFWVEAKRLEENLWRLRVGIGFHNHVGKAPELWAVQRKRTWGVRIGKIGQGGVTAQEEREKLARQVLASQGQGGASAGAMEGIIQEAVGQSSATARAGAYGLERGGLVWRIIEKEMCKKGGPRQGRDRGVGRTVKVLEEKLPGIRILKRDVYNLRASIRKWQKENPGIVPEYEDDDDDENEASESQPLNLSEIDPMLVAQCDEALRNVGLQQQNAEITKLKREVDMLRRELEFRTKEAEEKDAENQRLRVELDVIKLGSIGNMYHSGGGMNH